MAPASRLSDWRDELVNVRTLALEASTPVLEELEGLRQLRRDLAKLKDATLSAITAVNEVIATKIANDGDSSVLVADASNPPGNLLTFASLNPFETAKVVTMWVGHEDQYDEVADQVFATSQRGTYSAFYRRDGYVVAFLVRE